MATMSLSNEHIVLEPNLESHNVDVAALLEAWDVLAPVAVEVSIKQRANLWEFAGEECLLFAAIQRKVKPDKQEEQPQIEDEDSPFSPLPPVQPQSRCLFNPCNVLAASSVNDARPRPFLQQRPPPIPEQLWDSPTRQFYEHFHAQSLTRDLEMSNRSRDLINAVFGSETDRDHAGAPLGFETDANHVYAQPPSPWDVPILKADFSPGPVRVFPNDYPPVWNTAVSNPARASSADYPAWAAHPSTPTHIPSQQTPGRHQTSPNNPDPSLARNRTPLQPLSTVRSQNQQPQSTHPTLETAGILYVAPTPYASTVSVTVALRPSARGKGLASHATRVALGWAFDALGMHKVTAELMSSPDRAAALRLFTAAGFEQEGTRRRAVMNANGQWKNVVCLGMLDTEWVVRGGRKGTGARESAWDELLARHQKEREELLAWEERERLGKLQRTASVETIKEQVCSEGRCDALASAARVSMGPEAGAGSSARSSVGPFESAQPSPVVSPSPNYARGGLDPDKAVLHPPFPSPPQRILGNKLQWSQWLPEYDSAPASPAASESSRGAFSFVDPTSESRSASPDSPPRPPRRKKGKAKAKATQRGSTVPGPTATLLEPGSVPPSSTSLAFAWDELERALLDPDLPSPASGKTPLPHGHALPEHPAGGSASASDSEWDLV
ncbi:hypothetical protein AcV7_007021 [Taiwanofungus camphoratus]|nr:hypothetical protein AcV7_007021 [Antrodia cinnamomea]